MDLGIGKQSFPMLSTVMGISKKLSCDAYLLEIYSYRRRYSSVKFNSGNKKIYSSNVAITLEVVSISYHKVVSVRKNMHRQLQRNAVTTSMVHC